MEKMSKEEKKLELVNDLIAVSTVMEELWDYHPANPQKKDVEKEFKVLQNIENDILIEMDKLK